MKSAFVILVGSCEPCQNMRENAIFLWFIFITTIPSIFTGDSLFLYEWRDMTTKKIKIVLKNRNNHKTSEKSEKSVKNSDETFKF